MYTGKDSRATGLLGTKTVIKGAGIFSCEKGQGVFAADFFLTGMAGLNHNLFTQGVYFCV